jgi:nucleoside-diphosphate-sugar epimerase
VSGAVNIGSGEANSIKDVALRLASLTDHPELLRLGALPERAGDPPLLVPDTTRLNTELGWRPRSSLDHGLAETVSWWRSQISAERHAAAV